MDKNKEIKHITTPLLFNMNTKMDLPTNKMNINKGYVEWGKKLNGYGTFLLDLYEMNGSAMHTKCINKKVSLISGKGFVKEGIDASLLAFIEKHNLDELLYKITLDYEIFNAFAIEVVYAKDGKTFAFLQHIPIQNLLFGIKSEQYNYDHFLYSANWDEARKAIYQPEIIEAFNPQKRSGKQIFYYKNYSPSTKNIYPTPTYVNGIYWIKTQHLVGKYHFNQAENSYTPSFMMNLIGDPTPEEREDVERGLKQKFQGVENTNNMMLTFSDGQTSPNIIAFPSNANDKRFDTMIDVFKNEVVDSHEIPMQLVTLYPGKIGGSDERDIINKEFQNDYVQPRQKRIEDALNRLLAQVNLPKIQINNTSLTQQQQ